jgi:hypothetical protein
VRGVTTADNPKIIRTLKILLPTALPKAISPCPVALDITLTASSGALVPKATTVNPIINGDIPNAAADFAAPLTNASAPTISNTNPARIYRTAIISLLSWDI